MKDFKNKVAVVTGAASGIGRALAEHCAEEGMKVVLADIEEKPLARAEEEIKAKGASALAVVTDVSEGADVESLAKKTLDTFGAVHLLFNNAGIMGPPDYLWENSIGYWEWTVGVNLWGVIHGIRNFVPIMIEQDTDCHIVNTASVGGFTSGSGWGIYKLTKHGVVSLSETLYHELAQVGAKVHVSVLSPWFTKTQFPDWARNPPAGLKVDPQEKAESPQQKARVEAMGRGISKGMPPLQLADIVFDAIRNQRFYVFPDPGGKPHIEERMEEILEERNPKLR